MLKIYMLKMQTYGGDVKYEAFDEDDLASALRGVASYVENSERLNTRYVTLTRYDLAPSDEIAVEEYLGTDDWSDIMSGADELDSAIVHTSAAEHSVVSIDLHE